MFSIKEIVRSVENELILQNLYFHEYEPSLYKSAEHPMAEHCFPTSD